MTTVNHLAAARSHVDRAELELQKAKDFLIREETREAAQPKPWPQHSDPVFLAAGRVHEYKSSGSNDSWLPQYITAGQGFRTRSEAERYLEQARVTKKLRDLATAAGTPDVHKHFTIGYNRQAKTWEILTWTLVNPQGSITFTSWLDAHNAIQVLGTELDVLRSQS